MRLVVLGLSLLMLGCGGGGGDSANSDDQQPPQTPAEIKPTAPTVWHPNAESSLNNADVVKSAIIASFKSIEMTMVLSQGVFNKLPSSLFEDVPLKTVTAKCDPSGTNTISLSKQGYSYHSGFLFGECVSSGLIMNGEFIGDAVIGVSFGSGSGKYKVNGSFSSKDGEGIYAKSRAIKHTVMPAVVNGVTNELAFDTTIACQSNDSSCNTMGSIIAKTTSPIQFVNALTTSPVGGEIVITNSANRTWLVRVVQNGFDIYDGENSTVVPVDFLSWYSLAQ